MPTSQQHIDSKTPMGATLIADGAAFRMWAPEATDAYVITDELTAARTNPRWKPAEKDRLIHQHDDTWTGFVPGIRDGSPYRFWVVGKGSTGFKRDPYARELGTDPPFPHSDCLVRESSSYPWHDAGYRPPSFHELIIYQLHVGVFYGVDAQGRDKRVAVAKFLDVLDRLDHLRELGINAVQLMPIQEYPSPNSMGYNGVDYFSPEMNYQVEDADELNRYATKINQLLARVGQPGLNADQLHPGPNQLKVLIDLLHLNGIAAIFDVVYNHAGGDFGDQSLYFLDRQPNHNQNNSLFFTDAPWAGGLVFAFWNAGVRQFLIDNAKFFLEEYHVDGFRYDEVSVIDNHGGWFFCQDVSGTVRFVKPQAIQIAEYWNSSRALAALPPPTGMGFDAALGDGLRDQVREAIRQASFGRDAEVRMDRIRDALYPPTGFPGAWRVVQCVENHDIVYHDRPPHDWKPRIPYLADSNDRRSWYARSRSRVATGLVLTAPGIPMLFMGQEILEDKNWSDNPGFHLDTLIWWDGLIQDRAMRDHLQFCRDLIGLRRRHRALSGEAINVFHDHNGNRVLAFHRWIPDEGQDVVVIASLNELSFFSYQLGFPRAGQWREVFNSDFYDHHPNPEVRGNFGWIIAGGPSLHGLPASSQITIPANSLLVFAYDGA